MHTENDYQMKKAHQNCSNNQEHLNNIITCGCCFCLEIFDTSEIKDWIDDGKTALCPYCGIDALIGENTGFEITKEFLEEMNDYWF